MIEENKIKVSPVQGRGGEIDKTKDVEDIDVETGGDETKPMENPEWRTRYWDDSEVTQLLALWGDKSVQRELDGTRRDNQVFIKLSEDLSRRGIRRSPAQVREKIKILKREYRLCLGRTSSTSSTLTIPGSGGKHILPGKFKYFEQMKDILGNTSTSAGQSPNQSVPSPNETSSNENLSTCASSYLDYLQSYGTVPKPNQDAYDNKPLDLHVSSDAVNNLLRGGSPVDIGTTVEGHRTIYHQHRGRISPRSNYAKRPFSDVNRVTGANRVVSESSDSETNGGGPDPKRGRYYFEGGESKREDIYLVQDILDRIFNYFKESDERFFQLEEKRMRHEKELETLRQDRELKLLEKLCQMTAELRRCCHYHCQHCYKGDGGDTGEGMNSKSHSKYVHKSKESNFDQTTSATTNTAQTLTEQSKDN